MKDLLVCVDDSKMIDDGPKPVEGEIYTFMEGSKRPGFICLVEFGIEWRYRETCFRPVDLSYGPAICETIEQQIELENVLI